jgi:hypothetical protein
VKASLDTRVEAAVRRKPATAKRRGPIVDVNRRPAPQCLGEFIREMWSESCLSVVERT